MRESRWSWGIRCRFLRFASNTQRPASGATSSLLVDTICRTFELVVTITDAAVAGEFT